MDVPAGRKEAEKILTGEPLSLGYKPTLPIWAFWAGDGVRPDLRQLLLDVESMLMHPRVKIVLDYYRSGVAQAKFKIKSSTSEVGEFALRMLRRFWTRSRVQAQRCYEYGRCGYEVVYAVEEDKLVFSHLIDFFPLDATVLMYRQQYAGVRLRNSGTGGGQNSTDLWGPGHWPAKGLWLAHNRRYHRWYGLSQLYGAWRPWRRLAGRDGGEEVIDAGIYRFAYCGPILYYPAEDQKRKDPVTGLVDPMGMRDIAREFVENAKAGVSVALPSAVDDMGKGVRKWELVFPEHTLNVDGLLAYTAYLENQISLGIGVPPELLEATETGSGYSGRMIPMETFLTAQQSNAEDLVHEWAWQIGMPLVKWNFGPEAWFEVEVESLLETRQQAKLGQPQPGSQGSVPSDTSPDGGAGTAQGEGSAGGGAGGAMDPLAAMLGGGEAGNQPPAQMALETAPDAPEGTTAPATGEKMWQHYEGKRGRRKGQHGWRNRKTGRIVWDEGNSGFAMGGAPEVMPANVERVVEQIAKLRDGSTEPNAADVKRIAEQLLSMPVKDLQLLAQLAPVNLTPESARDIKAMLDAALS